MKKYQVMLLLLSIILTASTVFSGCQANSRTDADVRDSMNETASVSETTESEHSRSDSSSASSQQSERKKNNSNVSAQEKSGTLSAPESSENSDSSKPQGSQDVLQSSAEISSDTQSSAEPSHTAENSHFEISYQVSDHSDTELSVVSSVSEISVSEPSEVPSAPEISETEPSEAPSVSETSISEPSDEPVIPSEVSEEPTLSPIVDPYRYYTSEQVYQDMAQLCDRYESILTMEQIGTTLQNKPIYCMKLGKGSKKGCVVAGIHAREHITISFTMRCIEEYADSYMKDVSYGAYSVRKLLNEYTLYLIPMCNPDGTDIANLAGQPLVNVSQFDPDNYKLNANGVNLNRNFPYNWESQYANTPYHAGDEKYPGDHAASEKETQAIMKLCEENDFLWLLDMHIIGNGIFWRDQLNGVIPNDELFAQSIGRAGGYQVFGVSSDITTYSGGLENWFRKAYGRPALCIEMLPYSQAYYTDTYRGYNTYFETAINWQQSRYTYLEAMTCIG